MISLLRHASAAVRNNSTGEATFCSHPAQTRYALPLTILVSFAALSQLVPWCSLASRLCRLQATKPSGVSLLARGPFGLSLTSRADLCRASSPRPVRTLANPQVQASGAIPQRTTGPVLSVLLGIIPVLLASPFPAEVILPTHQPASSAVCAASVFAPLASSTNIVSDSLSVLSGWNRLP